MKKQTAILVAALCLSAGSSAQANFNFGISAPVLINDGNAYWGGNVDFLYEFQPGMQLGLESGFFSKSVSGVSLKIIPIVPTFLYSFDAGGFMPFVGAGLGLSYLHGSASTPSVTVGAVTVSGVTVSASKTEFTALGHLGAKFGKNVFVDIRFGVIDKFTLIPSVGVFF